jgi:hypothetical protein
MFTVLSKTRNSNLVLIVALAIAVVVLLTFTVVPAISVPQPALAPTSRLSEAGSDYYQRHPGGLVIPATARLDTAGSDYFQRHPELTGPAVLGLGASDYFQRHPELSASANVPIDECVDVSIGELAACRLADQTPVLTPGLACESPVDCR